MTWNASVYIFLLLCCAESAKINNAEYVDPRTLLLVFYNCNATDVILTECLMQDLNCIQNTYEQLSRNKRNITIYIHGHLGNRDVVPQPYFVSAYCSQTFSVIALLDWSKIARDEILMAAKRLPAMGKIVASTFNMLKRRGYQIEAWHFIGHSMGAHIVDCIAVHLNFPLLHATGLDPAGIIFYTDLYNGCQLNPNTAILTDAFYTDVGGFGTMRKVGTLNIYANTGVAPQPGCWFDPDYEFLSEKNVNACGHIKAAKWYADAVRERRYVATKCDDCFSFMHYGYCKENPSIYLGPHVNRTANGTYCLPIN